MVALYDRTITIKRAAHQTGVGVIGYGGGSEETEEPIATGIVCNVQSRGRSRSPPTGLPADDVPYTWSINVPRGQPIVAGQVLDRDLVTDDLGRRFIISAAYPHGMGWRFTCDALEN